MSTRFELNGKQSKQVMVIFDSSNSGDIDFKEFKKFCSTEDVPLAVKRALAAAERNVKTNIFSEHELVVSCMASSVFFFSNSPKGKISTKPKEQNPCGVYFPSNDSLCKVCVLPALRKWLTAFTAN